MSYPDYDSWITHNPADDYDEKDITVYHECGADLEDWDEDNPEDIKRSPDGLCYFGGEVDVTAYVGRLTTSYEWECPDCGQLHPEEVDTKDLYGYDED